MIIRRTALAACIALGLAASSGWAASTVGEVADDSILTAKVKTALIENPDTKAYQINVETKGGEVQLNGYVDSASAMQAAESTARSVSGVGSVANNLQIGSADHSTERVLDDVGITAMVKSDLIADARTKAYEIDVTTSGGVVSLGGFVASDAEKAAAESLAEAVDGVVQVKNGIVVKND